MDQDRVCGAMTEGPIGRVVCLLEAGHDGQCLGVPTPVRSGQLLEEQRPQQAPPQA